MTRRLHRLLPGVLAALLLSGCAVPTWVPWLGKPKPGDEDAKAASATQARLRRRLARADEKDAEKPKPPLVDDAVADRVVAVVNNDAITLAEILESIAAWRYENQQRSSTTDEELASQFLTRLIDSRLQLQEAEREKIVVDDAEVAEELAERVKKLGMPSMEAFEAAVKAQGMSVDAVRKRVRDGIRMQRVVRRKVALRVSVTEAEIDKYLDANRAKLETGLSYHARHILVTPEGDSEAAWEAARQKADTIRSEAAANADFAELARRHSSDASAKDGGDLGTLKRGELAKEIESHVLALEPGEVSAPYRSSLGWHVFKLETKEALEGASLTRVRQQIRDILFREKYETRFDAWLKEIKQRAVIEVRM